MKLLQTLRKILKDVVHIVRKYAYSKCENSSCDEMVLTQYCEYCETLYNDCALCEEVMKDAEFYVLCHNLTGEERLVCPSCKRAVVSKQVDEMPFPLWNGLDDEKWCETGCGCVLDYDTGNNQILNTTTGDVQNVCDFCFQDIISGHMGGYYDDEDWIELE